jgi:hypothetical protein
VVCPGADAHRFSASFDEQFLFGKLSCKKAKTLAS